ncbi:MAG: molybdopterin-dependent oxidoreductase, partial [Planctomycetes bacterium]|nr:molybdopterin-dependent oxidoreductase [Planctomycetota bacterium]
RPGAGVFAKPGFAFPLTGAKLQRPDLVPAGTRTINIVDVGRLLLDDDVDPPIRAVFIYNHNPVCTHPDQNRMRRALAREDVFVAGADVVMTDSMRWCDVVLPACSNFEHDDLYAAYGTTWLQRARPVIAPVGEALPNTEIFRRLAARFGFDDDCFLDDDEALLDAALVSIEGALLYRRGTPGDAARHWPSLAEVRPQDFAHLVHLRTPARAVRGESVGDVTPRGRPEPFALTDHRGGQREVAAELDLCMYCHERGKDSCSRGLRDKQGGLTRNPLGVALAGCPLDEKIGEAQALRRAGDPLAALVAITLDNPLCPGTGHRICNDCMKACIFQKQAPVNVPMVETRVLDEILALPWGFEIWSLLTRFSPLSLRRPIPRPHTGKKVLVVGLGPAGYTLAHYLLNEGFAVAAIDGLKIEPLPDEWLRAPIRDVETLRGPLESRPVLGFGGVSEYGITVRWDKSFL